MTKIHFISHVYHDDTISLLKQNRHNLEKFENITFTIPSTRMDIYSNLRQEFCDSNIFSVPNRGRDMYPFNYALNKLDLNSDDLIIKWHDKKRNHINNRSLNENERINLLRYCLPSKNLPYGALIEGLRKSNQASLITIEGWMIPLSLRLGLNQPKLFYFAQQENWDWDKIIRNSWFPSGGVFAARARSFLSSKWLDSDVNEIEFGHGGLDGTWAHASERWIGVLANRIGDLITLNI